MSQPTDDPTNAPQAAVAPPRIGLRLFGPPDLTAGESAAALREQPKRFALFAYLAAARPVGYQRRDRIVALFWPEHRQDLARTALRKAAWWIRQALGDDAVDSRGDEELAVNRAVVWCDALAFVEAAKADRLARALELYRGPFLDGFFADAPGFQRWADDERAYYREIALDCAWKLAERYEQGNELTSATRWARRAARLAGIADERVVRRVLQLLRRAGDRAGAVQVYDGFAKELRKEFGVEPAAETKALIREITGQ